MVFLYIPNIIGYFRFAFLFAILPIHHTHPYLTVLFYAISQGLDAFDGMAARKFNQCSKFGAVLDMVCDRASDAVMLAILGGLYPDYCWLFYGDIILDLVSHWYQMYASLMRGEHHKESKSKYRLLNLYYNDKTVLFSLVAGNEIFLLCAYLHAFSGTLAWPQGIVVANLTLGFIGFVLFAIKKMMSIIQLISASEKVA